MFLAVLFGSSFFYVQAYETWSSGDVSGLSEIGFTIALISSIFWYSYGTMTNNVIVRMSGALNFVACLAILGAIFTFRNSEETQKVTHDDISSIHDYIEYYGENRDRDLVSIVHLNEYEPLIIPEDIEKVEGKIDVL